MFLMILFGGLAGQNRTFFFGCGFFRLFLLNGVLTATNQAVVVDAIGCGLRFCMDHFSKLLPLLCFASLLRV